MKDYLPKMSHEEIDWLFEKHIKKALNVKHVSLSLNFMYSRSTKLQQPHVDFDWNSLDKYGNDLYVGFFPLTINGMEIVYWTETADSKMEGNCFGKKVCINYREMLLLPGKFPHAGGFCSGLDGNPRCHLYIAVRNGKLSTSDGNQYNKRNGPLFSKKFLY